MKTLKALSLSLLAAIGLTSSASAFSPTVVHVVGSTAFRAPTTAAILDYLSVGGTVPCYAGYSGTSVATAALLGAGQAIIANGTIDTPGGTNGTATVVVETYWTGSLAGVVDLVAANNTGAYFDYSTIGGSFSAGNIGSVNATPVTINPGDNSHVYTGGAALGSPSTTTAAPDMAMSDSNKATIQKELATAVNPLTGVGVGGYTSPTALAAACNSLPVDAGSSSGGAVNDGLVGVVPFEWVAGNITTGGYTIPTNITQEAVRGLIGVGYIAQSTLTGTNTTSDVANYFYLTGRNEDSGTRIGAFMESQYGVTAADHQYSVTGTTSTGATAIAQFPANSSLNTEVNIKWAATGHSGYASGGNVATALDWAESGSGLGHFAGNTGADYMIGYLGITDASSAITGGAHAFKYNGVSFSVPAVQNGQYTFWTFEHCYRLSGLSGTALTAVNAIADNIHDTDADVAGDGTHSVLSGSTAAGILYNSSFNVSRPVPTEGLPVVHN